MRVLAPGTVLAGYRIESLVGRGGMGVVYRALQLDLERVVALKVIAPELLDDDDVRARFLTEARAAASVDHPNVIPVHAAGEEDGIAYIAMRFVAGDDLRSLVRYGGPFDPAQASGDGRAGRGGAGRDPPGGLRAPRRQAGEPARRPRRPRLSDRLRAGEGRLHPAGGTRTGQWVGTLDYVSPEQIRGGRIDARADVYALGGVLHFALTGRVPFEREGDEAKLWAQLSAPPPVPSAVRAGLAGAVRRRGRARDGEGAGRALSRRRATSAAPPAPPRAAALRREPERMVARGAAAPGRGADRAGAGRGGLDAHRRAVPGQAPAPPPRVRCWSPAALLLAVVARSSPPRWSCARTRRAPRSSAARRPRRPRPRRRCRARWRRSRTSATARTGSRWPAATCGSSAHARRP